ncbi:CBS domain-containing protein [Vineibacter terrae]|uniref:CBS domain-containing protein n=1 Tax=Vineibacter terrae TaxID=2586908 RepID=A0A5C8PP21_9HYPH|nr:CBS domain-containing protein [Vineibacter terrae]TXL76305.1 CBS domain-containing protein [Vineibacter terrae]
MKLAEVMTRDVETIAPDASLQEAAQRMEELNVGALPVCDGAQLIGVVTDRDIIVRGVSVGALPGEDVVADCMSAEPLFAFEDEPVEHALDRMRSAQVRRLMVIDRDKQLVGVVSLGDVATKAPHKAQAAAALQEISTPSKPDRPTRPPRRKKEARP